MSNFLAALDQLGSSPQFLSHHSRQLNSGLTSAALARYEGSSALRLAIMVGSFRKGKIWKESTTCEEGFIKLICFSWGKKPCSLEC